MLKNFFYMYIILVKKINYVKTKLKENNKKMCQVNAQQV